jgi:hypothetical protein
VTVTMWEVRAAPGRLDDLIAYLRDAVPGATLYRDIAEERLVAIIPGETAVPGPPAELVARAPHAWTFEQV